MKRFKPSIGQPRLNVYQPLEGATFEQRGVTRQDCRTTLKPESGDLIHLAEQATVSNWQRYWTDSKSSMLLVQKQRLSHVGMVGQTMK